MTGQDQSGGTLTGDERTELQQARAELEQARAELAQARAEAAALRGGPPATPAALASPHRGRAWTRTAVAVLLITVGCVLAPLSVVAVWAKSQVSDTDRYVQTVAPLAEDPAIQDAITLNITTEVFRRIDVNSLTTRAVQALGETLPPDVAQQVAGLSGPIANGIRNFAQGQVARAVESDTFARAWTEANRAVHAQLVAALTGSGDSAVRVEGDTVSVDLSSFAAAVKQRLVESGFGLASRIPEINAEFVILQSADLPKVQRGFDLLNTLGFWLGPLCGVLIVLGVYVARNHRLAFIGAGLGLAVAMLVSGIALAALRSAYLDAVPPDRLPADAATTLFDTVVRYLRELIRATGLLGLVFAAGAFLTGPSVTATRIRGLCSRAAAAAAKGLVSIGLPLKPVVAWFGPRRQLWRVGLVVVAFAAFVVPAYPTPGLVLWLTAAVLAGLFIIQVLSSPVTPRDVRTSEPALAPT